MIWNYIIIGISILLALILCYQEYRRVNKARKGPRLLSICVAITALACIALPLSYHSHLSGDNDNAAVLITHSSGRNNFAFSDGQKAFTLDGAVHQKFPKSKFVNSVEDILLEDPTITSFHILGDGLNGYQLNQLGGLPIIFNAGESETGLQSISWDGQLQAGNMLRVQGDYSNTSTENVHLVLKGLNTTLDSVKVTKGTSSNFELNTTPKHEGHTVYHLYAISGKDTLSKEDLPVEITPFKPLRLLVLNASPDFETRFLKNWLTSKGYAAAIRSVISKNKFSTEFVNMPEQPVGQITTSLLQKFDVIVGDLSALETLTPSESGALREEVAQKGLGLVVRADSAGKESSWVQSGFIVEKAVTKSAPVSMIVRGKKSASAKLNTDGSYLVNRESAQVLVSDAQNHMQAGSSLSGNGKIVFTNLNNTYNWMLSGDETDYSALWSLLISEASRKANESEKWAVATNIPTENRKVKLQLKASSAPTQINADNINIPAVQNPLIPFEWDAEFWPAQSSWQQVNQQGRPQKWWYVWPRNAWDNIKALETRYQTRLYAGKHPLNASVTKQIQAIVAVPVPKIYFYMLFLFAAVFLWIEGKLSE